MLFSTQAQHFYLFKASYDALYMKPVNLQFITVGRRDDDMIVPPSDGPMFILID